MRLALEDVIKPLVRTVLENPEGRNWSLQGFGMLRLYLTPELRLHIWDSKYQVENVTLLHTHPWHFHSYVVAGIVEQYRYEEVTMSGKPFNRQTILCGEGGGLEGKPEPVKLLRGNLEIYGEGAIYVQQAHEIHASHPRDGTVTIIRREFLDDADHAYIYYPEGQEWVSAEPRPATVAEMGDICARSLDRYF